MDCGSKIRRQTGIAKFLSGLLKHILKIFGQINFQDIYFREFKEKRSAYILPRPEICNFCLLFRSAHLTKTVFSVHNKLPATLALSKKKKI